MLFGAKKYDSDTYFIQLKLFKHKNDRPNPVVKPVFTMNGAEPVQI